MYRPPTIAAERPHAHNRRQGKPCIATRWGMAQDLIPTCLRSMKYLSSDDVDGTPSMTKNKCPRTHVHNTHHDNATRIYKWAGFRPPRAWHVPHDMTRENLRHVPDLETDMSTPPEPAASSACVDPIIRNWMGAGRAAAFG